MGDLGLVWSLPFFCTLLTIALCPLLISEIWEKHSFKILLISPCVLLIALSVKFGVYEMVCGVIHSVFVHYIPLMALLFSLFVITGGIHVAIDRPATATLNTLVLFIGSVLAGWIGTTGASMLLIRPLLRINASRKQVVHLVVFFIFLVSNIGGAMTPLGDPPLFMGFLEGVDFFWTVRNLSGVIAITVAVLLTLFYLVDSLLLSKDKDPGKTKSYSGDIKISGGVNFALLILVVSLSMWGGMLNLGSTTIFTTKLENMNVLRDIILFLLAFVSMKITPDEVRTNNNFMFSSFREVAEIFIAIFITIIPVAEMLENGYHGAFAPLLHWVSGGGANLEPFRVFWACGGISAFLDNAPTYIMFFHLAGADPTYLMDSKIILKAISLGAVYMGSMTYIGNAPNLMVKSISSGAGVNMPSFFGYMLWSAGILLPLFLLGSVLLF